MFSLICVWINGWVNNHEAGDLRRYRAHHDVIVMVLSGVIDKRIHSLYDILKLFCMPAEEMLFSGDSFANIVYRNLEYVWKGNDIP